LKTEAWPANKTIALNDLFWTLQGEGRWTGYRALFVRLPFCNYNCPWCDTDFDAFKKWSQADFEDFCTKESARFAVITGGEPLIHKDLHQVLKTLKSLGFTIACETNGSAPIPEAIDFATVSPKPYTQKKHEPYYIHPEAWANADEFKYVVDDNFDFSILDKHENDSKERILSLSPEFTKMPEMTQRILNYIQENPKWRLNLQTHKWIDIP